MLAVRWGKGRESKVIPKNLREGGGFKYAVITMTEALEDLSLKEIVKLYSLGIKAKFKLKYVQKRL